MKDLGYLENRFQEVCFTLSEDDIFKLEQYDNGPLTNVISCINKECYLINLYGEPKDLTVNFFYVTKNEKLQGDVIKLKLDDSAYIDLLFKFCQMLVISYVELDTIHAFNTFQNKLRSLLEKSGHFTVTTLELKKMEGKSISMFSSSPIKKIVLINQVEFYRELFFNTYAILKSAEKEYVYLMVNTDSSLIKIGHSRNPDYREKTLHSKEPTVHLIACWETSKLKEKELHQKYLAKRVRGEWFRLNLYDLKEIIDFMNQ
jgi:hypothetical protein